MDWIAGRILETLDDKGLTNDTLVLFTSDNGPWVAEQSCAGSKGPFEGRWYVHSNTIDWSYVTLNSSRRLIPLVQNTRFRLQENVDQSCTACPHDYIPDPTPEQPRRCVLAGNDIFIEWRTLWT